MTQDSKTTEFDLDYELSQIAEIASPLEQESELKRLKSKSGESLEVLRRQLKYIQGQQTDHSAESVPLVPVEPAPASERQEGTALC